MTDEQRQTVKQFANFFNSDSIRAALAEIDRLNRELSDALCALNMLRTAIDSVGRDDEQKEGARADDQSSR